jgi:hypothetical protein
MKEIIKKYGFALFMFFWGAICGGGLVLLVCIYG